VEKAWDVTRQRRKQREHTTITSSTELRPSPRRGPRSSRASLGVSPTTTGRQTPKENTSDSMRRRSRRHEQSTTMSRRGLSLSSTRGPRSSRASPGASPITNGKQNARINTLAVMRWRKTRRGRTTSKLHASASPSTSSRPPGPRARARGRGEDGGGGGRRRQCGLQTRCADDSGESEDQEGEAG